MVSDDLFNQQLLTEAVGPRPVLQLRTLVSTS